MRFLKNKLNIFVAVALSSCLTLLLITGHLQPVNAAISGASTFDRSGTQPVDISADTTLPAIPEQDSEEASLEATELPSSNGTLTDGTLVAQVSPFLNLTGDWQCNDGGIYYLRQRGSELYWYGERVPVNPNFSNVYRGVSSGSGVRVGNQISGGWLDVPKGSIASSGSLTLRVVSSTRLDRVSQTGGFGGSSWTKIRSGF